MSTKRLITLLVALALAAFVAACGDDGHADSAGSSDGTTQAASDSGNKKPKVAIVHKTLANPVWQAVDQGAKEKADELGIELISKAGKTEEDIQGQINIIEDLTVQDVDVIVISANGTGQLRPVLQRAEQQGIKIILIDTDVPDIPRETLVATDNQGMSKKISDALVQELGKKGDVGILTFPQVSSVEARVAGTKDAIEGTDLKVKSELAGDCLRNKAVNSTTDMLQANPQLVGIFGECGQNATGAVQAIKSAGKTPGKDVKVIGFDGVPQELDLIKNGEEFATVWQDFTGIGVKAIEVALGSFNGKKYDPITYVDGVVITKDNVDDFKADGDIVVRAGA